MVEVAAATDRCRQLGLVPTAPPVATSTTAHIAAAPGIPFPAFHPTPTATPMVLSIKVTPEATADNTADLPNPAGMTTSTKTDTDQTVDGAGSPARRTSSIAGMAIWDLGGRFANYFVLFGTSVILTRILSPEEFGSAAIVLTVIGLSAIFVDLGFRTAIIQAKELSQEKLSTVFYVNLFVALLLVGVCFAASGSVESFYEVEGLAAYINAASAMFAINGVALVPGGLLQRDLQLKSISIINTVAAMVSAAIAIGMAVSGYKVWALIVPQLVAAAVIASGYFYKSRWLPSVKFRLASIAEMWRFGVRMFASGVADTVFTRLDVFIIGKMFPLQTLGYYNRAQSLDVFVRGISASTTTSIAFPVIARMGDDDEAVRSFYLRCLNMIAFLSFLLTGVLFLTCFDIFVILYTEKWETAAYYFRLMAVVGFVYPLSALMVNLVAARGRSDKFLKLELLKKAVLIPTYVTFVFGGIYLFLAALAVAYLISLGLNAYFVKNEIGTSLSAQFSNIIGYAAAAVGSSAVVYVIGLAFENIYIHLAVSTLLFAAVYFACCYAFRLAGFFEIFDRAVQIYNDKRHANVSSAA